MELPVVRGGDLESVGAGRGQVGEPRVLRILVTGEDPGRGKLGEVGLLRGPTIGGGWVGERVLKQHFFNRLPHLPREKNNQSQSQLKIEIGLKTQSFLEVFLVSALCCCVNGSG